MKYYSLYALVHTVSLICENCVLKCFIAPVPVPFQAVGSGSSGLLVPLCG